MGRRLRKCLLSKYKIFKQKFYGMFTLHYYGRSGGKEKSFQDYSPFEVLRKFVVAFLIKFLECLRNNVDAS